jgi:hypothetical protein
MQDEADRSDAVRSSAESAPHDVCPKALEIHARMCIAGESLLMADGLQVVRAKPAQRPMS